MRSIRTFTKGEAGAASIDWIVLAAAIVAMGVAAGTAVRIEAGKSTNGDSTTSASVT